MGSTQPFALPSGDGPRRAGVGQPRISRRSDCSSSTVGDLLHDPDHAGVAAVLLHVAAVGVGDPLGGRQPRRRRPAAGVHLRLHPLQDLAEHVLLRVEVRVEGAVGGPGGGADVGDPCLVVAVAFEHLPGGHEQALAGPLAPRGEPLGRAAAGGGRGGVGGLRVGLHGAEPRAARQCSGAAPAPPGRASMRTVPAVPSTVTSVPSGMRRVRVVDGGDAWDAQLPRHDHGVAAHRTDVDDHRAGGDEQRRP